MEEYRDYCFEGCILECEPYDEHDADTECGWEEIYPSIEGEKEVCR